MKTPAEIIDFLESLLGIYFYEIRHKHRSVFILCDTLVELSCKIKIVEKNEGANTKGLNFKEALQNAKVPSKLKKRLLANHSLRNDMQHKSTILTIDEQKCADSIMDLVELLKKLWGKYSLDYNPNWVDCALRIIKLHSSQGRIKKRKEFKEYILNEIDWNYVEPKEDKRVFTPSDNPNVYNFLGSGGAAPGKQEIHKNELVIKIGSEEHWSYILRHYTEKVEECLSILSIEDV
jgi:transcription antitermination factor NusG